MSSTDGEVPPGGANFSMRSATVPARSDGVLGAEELF